MTENSRQGKLLAMRAISLSLLLTLLAAGSATTSASETPPLMASPPDVCTEVSSPWPLTRLWTCAKEWQTVWAGLFALLGAAGVIYVVRSDRRRRLHGAVAALRAEVNSIGWRAFNATSMNEKQETGPDLRGSGGPPEAAALLAQLGGDPVIFHRAATDLHLLPPELRGEVTAFYLRAAATRAALDAVDRSVETDYDSEQLKRHAIQQFPELFTRGSELQDKLQAYNEDTYWKRMFGRRSIGRSRSSGRRE